MTGKSSERGAKGFWSLHMALSSFSSRELISSVKHETELTNP